MREKLPEIIELLKDAKVELDKIACLSPEEDWISASNLAQRISSFLRQIEERSV